MFIIQKVRVALATGLDVVFCAGETLAQREADQCLAIARAGMSETHTKGEPA